MQTPRRLFLFTQYRFLAPQGCFWILALDPPPWAPGPLGPFLLGFCWSLLSFRTGPPACCCGPPVPAGGSLSPVTQGLSHMVKPGTWPCAGQGTGAAVREPWGQATAEGPVGRRHGGGHEHLPGPLRPSCRGVVRKGSTWLGPSRCCHGIWGQGSACSEA